MECGTSLAECEFESENDRITLSSAEIWESPLVSANEQSAATELVREDLADDLISANQISSPFEQATESPQPSHRRPLTVPLVYCDQTASNKALRSVEHFIAHTCLPLYGNTHTNTSLTGSQSTAFVAEARQIVAETVNAKITGKASLDVVLFTGAGTTAAVETLIDCIGLRDLVALAQTPDSGYGMPVVLLGPYEHHSNMIPWREAGPIIINVPECPIHRDVDYSFLQTQLEQLTRHQPDLQSQSSNRLILGAFTAASNVTGKVCDVDRIASLLHTYNALAFFDYATAAPYLPMDMNPVTTTLQAAYKDAIYFSPHKMVGGINTPGVLVLKKQLVHQSRPPSRSGGGTVFYVTHEDHRFLSNRVERYEGGTPNVVGIMRVGLTFLVRRQIMARYEHAWKYGSNDPNQIQIGPTNGHLGMTHSCLLDLKEKYTVSSKVYLQQFGVFDNYSLGWPPKTILDYDYQTHRYVVDRLLKTRNIFLLGQAHKNTPYPENHLPIFSFLIKCGQRFLHYNYVCAILNDLFGIQSRGGCQCAGPYSQYLLGLTSISHDPTIMKYSLTPNASNRLIEDALLKYKERAELLRPGYSRLSLPFKGLRTDQVMYVVTALEWIAKNGWAFMCLYRCNHRTGEWRHAARKGRPLGQAERLWLSHFEAFSEHPTPQLVNHKTKTDWKATLDEALKHAEQQLQLARTHHISIAQTLKMVHDDNELLGGTEDAAHELDSLRWYVYPHEIASALKDGLDVVPGTDSLQDIQGAIRPLGYMDPAPDHVDQGSTCERSMRRTEACTLVCALQNTPDNRIRSVCTIKKQTRSKETWGKIMNDTEAPIGTKNNSHPALSEASPTTTIVPLIKSQIKIGKVRPPAKLMRNINQAIIQWDMIQNGDRLLLGLSGGKDSLSLLHCLIEYRRKNPVSFDLEVCTIDPMTPSFDPSPLIPYVESLGLTYHYIRENIVERGKVSGKDGQVVTSLCAFCARMKRGSLYSCARRNNCNKLVLAQHLDDLAESMFMSLMHNGFIRTMKANYTINAGDLSVIRPLVYCREGQMTDFAKGANLPVINENCPACFEEPKERARIKKLLLRESTLYPNLYDNLRRAMIPIMKDETSAILRCYTEEAVAKSRGKSHLPSADCVPNTVQVTDSTDDLAKFSDEDLLKEVARRKAMQYSQYGAMKRFVDDDQPMHTDLSSEFGNNYQMDNH